MDEQPLVPDYSGACVCNIVPALLDPACRVPGWLPAGVGDADQVVLFVIDGLGWCQLQQRLSLMPTLAAMEGGPISTVAPSTTSTALTSITTGLTPGLHGVIGYRMDVDGEVLNVLRWTVANRDARDLIAPEKIQPARPFLEQRPPLITRTEFFESGFTHAHLDGARIHGYRVTSTIVAEAKRLLRASEPFVNCYYEGIDKVAHEFGLEDHYEAELRATDHLVADLIEALPRHATLLVVADHGQVDVGKRIERINPDVLALTSMLSGEGRFRWLHARAGRADQLIEVASARHGDTAWVLSRDEIIEAGWFGPTVAAAVRQRLGDVALVARDPVAFFDPDDTGPYVMLARHGSLTEDEMLVPLLAARS